MLPDADELPPAGGGGLRGRGERNGLKCGSGVLGETGGFLRGNPGFGVDLLAPELRGDHPTTSFLTLVGDVNSSILQLEGRVGVRNCGLSLSSSISSGGELRHRRFSPLLGVTGVLILALADCSCSGPNFVGTFGVVGALAASNAAASTGKSSFQIGGKVF